MADAIVLPILSARSRASGKYQLACDGNLQMVLHRHWQEICDGELTLGLPLPSQCDYSQLAELLAILPQSAKLECFRYGETIHETRAKFWHYNNWPAYEKVLTGIPFMRDEILPIGYEQGTFAKFLLNCSKQANVKQPCDSNWQNDLHTICYADETAVLDVGQFATICFANQSHKISQIGEYAKISLEYFSQLPRQKPSGLEPIIASGREPVLITFKLSDNEHNQLLAKWLDASANKQYLPIFGDPTRAYSNGDQLGNGFVWHFSPAEYRWLLAIGKFAVADYGLPEITHPGRLLAKALNCKLIAKGAK